MVCDALELGPDDHVLEIGCGWGSFALTAAGEYGARVTGITLSPAQAELARRRVAEAGLADRVEIRLQDFREVDETFTKVASIEMIEAIGEPLLPIVLRDRDRVIAPGGRACIQSILIPDARYRRYRSSPDWIERYVFPGCLIPSLGALARGRRPAPDRTRSSRSAPTTARRSRAGARPSTSGSAPFASSATTSGSCGRGTSISPRARRSSARASSTTRTSW